VTTSPPILRYFDYGHLPEHLRVVSQEFEEMARWLVENVPGSAEQTVALRKLLESKDAAVRASLDGLNEPSTTDLTA
jgi:hypothetical protein